MQFNRFGTMLPCSNTQAAKAFYVACLGLQVTADLGWFVGLKRADELLPEFELSLCDADHASLPPTLRTPVQGLVMAFGVADADAEHARLCAADVAILAAPVDEPWGQRHFFAAAPDGVALDVFQPIAPDPAWMKANGFT